MMRFKRFSRSKAAIAQPVGHVAAILLAGLAGGCSAQVSGFDFPSFSLNDEPKPQQTASASGRGNPSYLGNDGYGNGGGSYNAPRTYRDSDVSSQSLPDASPPNNYAANDRRYGSPPSNGYAANGRYDNARRTIPIRTAATTPRQRRRRIPPTATIRSRSRRWRTPAT